MTVISGALALDLIRGAFFPLHCGAGLYDNDEKIRFRLVDSENKEILNVLNVMKHEFTDADRLEVLLLRFRDDVATHKGVNLEGWKMPDVRIIGA